MHTFSKFKNTVDNPVVLDEEEDPVSMNPEACQNDEQSVQLHEETDSTNVKVILEAAEPDELTVLVQKELDSTYESVIPEAVEPDELTVLVQKVLDSTYESVPEDHANTKASSCHEIHKHEHRHIAMNPNAVQDYEQILPVQEADASTHLNGKTRRKSIALDETKDRGKDETNKGKERLEDSDASEGNEYGLENLRTRTSPRTLHQTIVGLNDAQKKVVKQMGLGALLEMTINGVPSKLGFYVVDNLDVKKMELKVVNGAIPITIESIHELLGLRMGGVDILEMDEVEDSKNMTTNWRKQFDKKKMRPKDIMKIIQSSGDAGFNFKLNFLVLFVNLMLLYVEATISPKVVVEHKGHAISAWTLDLLKKRQSTEIKDGGFGLLPLRPIAKSSEDVHHRYASNQENIGEQSTPTHLSKENPSVVVIDNRYQEVSDDDQLLQMYDFITDILQRLMTMHLNAVGHPAGRELDEIGQERLRMDWQTQNNFDDCGVFAMRHMETYMGNVRTWNTSLSKEGKTQEIQIASLRMKYVAKLLVNNYNKKKEYVVKEVEKFQSMDEAIRKKLRKHVDETKTERLQI
ncbi:hypothetical protein Ccrd_022399 [Cynara cardunculus var. scolymus]|uniref:Peptidase C48, SUMO/Sentrin/Ubl1 n=1 Tax=Cynara cardunculus var. scolymus TaxID=59895 RepID=A0A118JZU2_CYNCS|nr:hypothetical protein Ccrd_022399 [Cynara cardunculus var. scolymus]